MMKSYEPFPILRFCVVWLYIFIPSKARSGSFVPADSIIFVAEDAYVYSETSVFVAGSGHNKGFTSAKKSKDFLKRSSLPFSTQKSVNIPAIRLAIQEVRGVNMTPDAFLMPQCWGLREIFQ